MRTAPIVLAAFASSVLTLLGFQILTGANAAARPLVAVRTSFAGEYSLPVRGSRGGIFISARRLWTPAITSCSRSI